MGWVTRQRALQGSLYVVLGIWLVLSLSLMGLSPRPAPLRAEPTARNTPTPENTWTTTPTFTATPTKTGTPTPVLPTVPVEPTTPAAPTVTEAPTGTHEPTVTRTTTREPTGTPPLDGVVTAIVTPIWMYGVPVPTYGYGTQLPISGVEPTWTPTIPAPPTDTQTPVPMGTRAPSPTVTPTSTPSDRLGPAAPASLVATAGNGVVILEWTPNGEPDLDGYRVYRSSAQGSGYSKMVSVTKKQSRYVDTSVTNEVTYYYVVSAFDTAGNESPFSDEVSIMPSAQKGMPYSGADFSDGILFSPWLGAVFLSLILLALVSLRRSGIAKSE